MKEYPSISDRINRDQEIYAFDKIDGSNVRAEWSRKNGFYKFGSRKRLIDSTDEQLGEAVLLIKEKERQLDAIFRKERFENVVCFFEFYGEHSFAGQHKNEPHKVVLIEVNVHKKGFIPPKEFVKLFEIVGIPQVVYHGKANHMFEESVKSGSLPGMTFEGVVCKAAYKKNHMIFFKIKSQQWIDKLRNFCGDDEQKFNSLA